MTTYNNDAVALDTSGLVAGTAANASDVKTPLDEAEAAIEVARGTVSVSENSTRHAHLNDALVAGSAIAKSVLNSGAAETLQLAVTSGVSPNGFVLAADGSGGVAFQNPSVLGTAQGAVDIVVTAGETLGLRAAVYIDPSDNQAYLLDTAQPAGFMIGVVTHSGGIASGASGVVRVLGEVSGFSGLTAGQPVYASTTTAGAVTPTAPIPVVGGGTLTDVRVGIAISSSAMIVQPSLCYRRQAALAAGDSLTVIHHALNTRQVRVVRTVDRSGNIATSGGSSASSGTAAAAFNGVFNELTDCWLPSTATETLQYDFGAGVSKTITQYVIDGVAAEVGFSERTMGAWTFEGSNDASAWTVLDTQSGFTRTDWYQRQTFQFDNATAYRYYRWNITAAAESGQPAGIGNAQLMETIPPYFEVIGHIPVRLDDGSGSNSTTRTTLTNTLPYPATLTLTVFP